MRASSPRKVSWLFTSLLVTSLLVTSLVTTACGVEPVLDVDAGTDAATPTPDGGPPRVAPFAELGATAEGIALGRTPDGSSTLYVGTRDDRIVRVMPDGSTEAFVSLNGPLGIAVRADGDLVVCAKSATGASGVFNVTPEGTISTLVATDPDGEPFGLTNFVAVAPDDTLIFTDSMANRVYRADADGGDLRLVTDAITFPNGLAFAPDGATLYVASWNGQTVHALAFDRETSTYGPPAVSIADVPNVDGIVTTSTGALVLVTSTIGVVLAEPGSSSSETLAPARAIGLPANGVFGDEAFGPSNLFIASLGEMQVFRVRTELAGAPLPAR